MRFDNTTNYLYNIPIYFKYHYIATGGLGVLNKIYL